MALLNKFDSLIGIKRMDTRECLGIYISLQNVYVCQIIEKSGGIEVETLIKLPIGDVSGALLKPAELNEGFFSNASYWLEPIKKIISSKKWNTKNVVVSLAPNFCIHRHFTMPDMPRKHWRKAIPLQARKYIHYPFERGVYDYYVYPFFAGLSKTKRLGVVFSLTSARIASTIEAGMKSIGLNLAALETSPMSIYRLFNQTDKEAMPGKGCIYSNFTSHLGQFLFGLNNAPILMREVEVQKAIGNRNRLEVNNLVDFVSKQLEKNPFEDTVVVSDDGEFWGPILEAEVKRPVRKWRISDIFGFKVEGFAEMAPIGACLKFLNQKVVDIDLYRKHRSTDEEVRGIMTIWKITGIALLLMLVWSGFVNFSAFKAAASLSKQNVASVSRVADFQGLYASQIEEKVRTMVKNAQTLSSVSKDVSFTEKLNVIPKLLPAEMWLTKLEMRYPFTFRSIKEKNAMLMEGYASTMEGRSKELEFGKTFTSNVNNSPDMKDICDGEARVDYGFEDLSTSRARAAAVLGTKFTLRCEKEVR